MFFTLMRKVLVNRACQEEYDNNCCGDPNGTVEVRVPFKHIEEIGARVDCCNASTQNFSSVDIEGLCIERESPEEVFARAGGGGGCGLREERRRFRMGFCATARGWGFKICFFFEFMDIAWRGIRAYWSCGIRGPLGDRCGLSRPVYV